MDDYTRELIRQSNEENTQRTKRDTEWFNRGVEAGTKGKFDRSELAVKAFAGKVMSLMSPIGTTTNDQRSWWPQFQRASEHIVHDSAGAPANSGEFQVSPYDQVLTTAILDESWVEDAMPVIRYTRMIESLPGQPIPKLPFLSVPPTAGTRTGEKQSMHSAHYDIVDATTTTIDATTVLNISQVALEMGFAPLNNTMMKAATAARMSMQVAQAVEAAAGAGGMANFTGNRYVPKVVVVPPEELGTINASNLVASGMTVVIDTQVTTTLVLDPNAIIGWFKQGRMEQVNPAEFGTEIAFNCYGQVAVDPSGVSTLTTTP